jgi:putative membrane protein
MNERTAAAEKKTKRPDRCAVIGKSDTYAELPWKAFCAGRFAGRSRGALAEHPAPARLALAVCFFSRRYFAWGRAGAALPVVFIPAFARLFLSVSRADTEVRQYADSLFLSREMFAVPRRGSVLLLVSLFERRIVVLPDAGLVRQLDAQAASAIIRSMRPELIAGRRPRRWRREWQNSKICFRTAAVGGGKHAADDVIEEEGT